MGGWTDPYQGGFGHSVISKAILSSMFIVFNFSIISPSPALPSVGWSAQVNLGLSSAAPAPAPSCRQPRVSDTREIVVLVIRIKIFKFLKMKISISFL